MIDAAAETVTIGRIHRNKLSKACKIKDVLSMKRATNSSVSCEREDTASRVPAIISHAETAGCRDSPAAFLFANAQGGAQDTRHYRAYFGD